MSATHIAVVSFIGRRQKTAKTCCGKVAKVECIAIDADATCTECRAVRDTDHGAYAALREHYVAKGMDTTELDASLEKAEPLKYRTVYFL